MHHYLINISRHGRHFATLDLKTRSDSEARDRAVEVYGRFPPTEGWAVTLTEWTTPWGRELNIFTTQETL